MKPILIRKPCIPFYLESGKELFVPGTPFAIVAYPTKLFVRDINREDASSDGKSFLGEIEIEAVYPVKNFMVSLDLERGCLHVRGEAENGFFSLRIFGDQNRLFCRVERCKNEGIKIGEFLRKRKDSFCLFSAVSSDNKVKKEKEIPLSGSRLKTLDSIETAVESLLQNSQLKAKKLERLSFGVHKAQNLQRVKERRDFEESLAILYKMSHWMPENVENATISLESFWEDLLCQMHEGIEKKQKKQLEGLINSLFSELLYQEKFSGIPRCMFPQELLRRSAKIIREMFVSYQREAENTVEILPCLLVPLHAGRFTGISFGSDFSLDIEWSKKQVRRVILHVEKPLELRFVFSKENSYYRMFRGNQAENSKGERGFSLRHAKKQAKLLTNGVKGHFSKGKYFFDNFSAR